MDRNKQKWIWLTSVLLVLVSACNVPQSTVDPAQPDGDRNVEMILTEMAVQTAEPQTAATDAGQNTAAPEKVLNVCLGREPESLFIYKSSSRSMWSILESIYDGPFDSLNGESVPVIFDQIRIEQETVPVEAEAIVFTAEGEIGALQSGVKIISADAAERCGTANCVTDWDGSTPIEMVQTKITYILKDGLLWSDGTPLQSQDSLFSWQLDADPEIKTSKRNQQLTAAYTAPDDLRIQWIGIPGFVPQYSAEMFWHPLPEHLMGQMQVSEILADETINRAPVGWGAYQLARWEPGKQIEMVRNPSYWRVLKENTPYFDRIVYKFYGVSGDNNLAALKKGDCDVIDTTVDLRVDLEPVLEDVRDEKLAAYIQPVASWEQLAFNLAPQGSAADTFFADQNVRKAIGQCIDRERLIREVFYGQAEIPVGFYPLGHYFADATILVLQYDPEAAQAALNSAGWIDPDGDPATPRVSQGVPGVTDGTVFSIELLTSPSDVRKKTSEFIASALAGCGIETTVATEPLDVFYGQGPEGPLFGRTFETALFSWSGVNQFPCSLFSDSHIPTAENNWIGVNLGGYSSYSYNAACRTAANGLLLYPENRAAVSEVQRIYAEELPVIPLYFDYSMGVSDLHICGLENAVGTRSFLWNIENLSRSGAACAVSQWQDIYQNE